MTFGKIWEIVFFNWDDWIKIKKMDGMSKSRKIHMELKNKSTIMNQNSRHGLKIKLKEFENENPGYRSVIGYVHDLTNTEKIEKNDELGLTIYYYGGDALFNNFFGDF